MPRARHDWIQEYRGQSVMCERAAVIVDLLNSVRISAIIPRSGTHIWLAAISLIR